MKALIPVFLTALLCPCQSARARKELFRILPANRVLALSGGQTASSTSSSSSSTKKNKPIPSFLIIGTVFDEKGLSFPGVHVRIRRTGEKKFRWDTTTNSRGEFAVRVPPGYDYQVVSHMKKYEDQTRAVDSKVDVQQRLSIQLVPRGKTTTGAKP
jgi:Carboxypeptidase regulatory-like domain